MKPDWKYAPEWANWLSQDRDGSWFYYENKPSIRRGEWAIIGGRCDYARNMLRNEWRESLEERPK